MTHSLQEVVKVLCSELASVVVKGAGSSVFLTRSLTPACDKYVLWLSDVVSAELDILLSSFLTNQR